jgi:hypothetical protein
MILIGIVVTMYLIYTGYDYYQTPLEERFYHNNHEWFKPSGAYGHGLGILGTFMILLGVTIYIARKRYNFLSRAIRLKYLLEFHIFLCTLGPILIVFHTAFKFGGIVSIAFWSMVAVVLSGVIGRFIYIQIPRTIDGQALTLNEVISMKKEAGLSLQNNIHMSAETLSLLGSNDISGNTVIQSSYIKDLLNLRKNMKIIRKDLNSKTLSSSDKKQILSAVKQEFTLEHKIKRLQLMQRLFKYWHVAHLPFALIMLIIVVIHVVITLLFGYKWIF